MKIRIVGSASGGASQNHYLTTFIIDDVVAIDAGSLGIVGEPDDQLRIRDVFISHTHADHIATLPVFVENAFRGTAECPTIHAHPEAIATLQSDVFNDRIWPDFIRLSSHTAPFMRFSPLQDETPVRVGHLEVLPVPVNHSFPSHGFILDDGRVRVAISSDTGPTDRLWALARGPRLAAAFIEVSFPNSESTLAGLSFHLTPALLVDEVAKLDSDVPIIAYHLKSRWRRVIISELERLGNKNLRIAAPDEDYVF